MNPIKKICVCLSVLPFLLTSATTLPYSNIAKRSINGTFITGGFVSDGDGIKFLKCSL